MSWRFACIGLLLLSSCGRDEALAGGPTIRFRPAESGATAFGEIPFPSDLYRDAEGNVGAIPGLERVSEHHAPIDEGLSALDGFGRSTGALFFTDGFVPEATLPRTYDEATRADAPVFIADVDPESLLHGTRYPAVAKFLPTLDCLTVTPVPGIVLPPGVRHAIVVTRAIARPDDALERVDGGLYGDAIDRMLEDGVLGARSEIAGLSVFTTSKRASELFALRDRLKNQPDPDFLWAPADAAPYTVVGFGGPDEPTLDDWLGIPDRDDTGREWPGGDNAGGLAHDAIQRVASAAFVAPSFLDPVTHHFERDANGELVLAQPNATIPVTIVIPKAPPPSAGYPVVISGHGLSNHRGSMLSIANELARAGFVLIGIDDVAHGARQGIVDEKNVFPGTYDGPDGIPDETGLPLAFFASFQDFVAVRDNFRQTVLDQTSLVRLIQNPTLALEPLGSPKLDPSRIYWSGGSLGGMMGSMTVAVEPEIKAAALHVPGASFVELITTSSAKVSGLVTGLALGTFGAKGEETLDEFHPIAQLLGMVSEAGDPIAYAPHVLRDPPPGRPPVDVLVTYSLYDEVMPNIATHALIRALGVEVAEPYLVGVEGVATVAAPVSGNLANGRTGVAFEYAPSNHALGYERFDLREFLPGVPFSGTERFPKLPKSFDVEMPVREHADQLTTFLSSGVAPSTAPPRADYDGDGVLDEVDGDPLDPSEK